MARASWLAIVVAVSSCALALTINPGGAHAATADNGCDTLNMRVRFTGGGASIDAQDATLLRQQLRLFENCTVRRARVEISGGTPDKADDRAQAVRDALEDAGIEPQKITASSVSGTPPMPPSVTSQQSARGPDNDGARLPRYTTPTARITVTYE